MMYDPLTDLFVPAFFTLATNKTQDLYMKMLKCIEFALDRQTWLETYPPDLWNIYVVRRQIVNRTNNPLESFHRELNARMKPHATLKRFVRVIEEITREYVVFRRSNISGDATAPVQPNLHFPRVIAY
ncbi:Hypothetical protein PHPALM_3797 [Phytophthora palmivora]|uniref:MULE transposase domain-containing protein n=1 Tax=Phytophthora palmivora TaxID=4796 RepID=A0A2P4YLN0_9STRA|nr:Hypothetical protein PHPALM_3797 [Phytophthora palmivora]